MNILYGVQGTGQGHISRSRAIAREMAERGARVTWLISGRERCRLIGTEYFGDFLHRPGLSFCTRAGAIDIGNTIMQARPLQFLRDTLGLRLDDYDLIVTDYEPVTAWAGRLANRRVIGIGHQYAFGGGAPMTGDRWWSRALMRHFAPVTLPVGLHWHRYDDHVLPPVIDIEEQRVEDGPHVLVYLPFEDQHEVTRWLNRLPQARFIQYAPGLPHSQRGNAELRPTDSVTFKPALARCRGVICNSGFELVSEALSWGKPVLTKPVLGQLEQQSNALALERLGFAQVTHSLDNERLERWLNQPPATARQHYPNVARHLADWLAGGALESPAQLARELWRLTGAPPTLPMAVPSAGRGLSMPAPRPAA